MLGAGLAFGVIGLPGLGGGGAPGFVASAGAQSEGETVFRVDAVHSMVVFKVKHASVAYNYGRFNTIEGSFNIDEDNLDASFIRAAIRAESIDTGNDSRDSHLRSGDFFNAGEYPVISFESSGFRAGEDDTMVVDGTLSMLGRTKDIEVELEKTGEGDVGRGYKQGFHAEFTIERSEFGMTKYLDGSIDDEVTIIVSFEGDRQ